MTTPARSSRPLSPALVPPIDGRDERRAVRRTTVRAVVGAVLALAVLLGVVTAVVVQLAEGVLGSVGGA
ncbi:hypothetical protein CLV28_0569 [Sediminihabitans luteus]|uniref:Uncharacterized protein n=1 Tax=Sediminihabitans luteus TaxID=1138585 RepID=A0A2M9CZM0_9CELL|nr:hypothetical protein [Sediminihabitans luteus]PJJ77350.1 hypothetical protein CLV28_0569 [Sediminihabitans luteus]GII98801.1 hypothetical protein Slu03_11790 [Sediminihabitans luteus]